MGVRQKSRKGRNTAGPQCTPKARVDYCRAMEGWEFSLLVEALRRHPQMPVPVVVAFSEKPRGGS